jgi:hypothetical protein
MTTKQTKESLSETFLLGLTGIFKITGFKKIFFTSWVTITPIFIAVLGLLICFIGGLDTYLFVVEVKSQMIGFLPGILGFTIAGYSLMVGFIQAGMLDTITEPMKDSKFSLYQSMSATFASNVLLQALALILAYFVHFIIYYDEATKISLKIPAQLSSIFNAFALLLLLYWFWLSVFMVVQIVLNIFGFSQLHHYFINKNKVEAKEKELSENPE